MLERTSRVLLAIVLAAAASGGCGEKAIVRPPISGDHTFALVYSQANLGEIEPCSCNNRTRGGFPRRCTFLKSIRGNFPTLVLDAGNSLFSENVVYPEQAKQKARSIAEAYVHCGIDGMVFGEHDLAMGGRYFRELVEQYRLPVLAANVLSRKTGEPIFKRYEIFEKDGVKVAVLGLIAPELRPIVSEANEEGSVRVQASKEKKVILEELFEDRDVKIEDPVVVAQELVPELRAKANLVVVLSHMPPRMSKEFGVAVPGVDVVVGSHAPSNRPTYSIVGPSLYLSSVMNGAALGWTEFHVRGGSLLFDDWTPVDAARKALPNLREWRDSIIADYGANTPDALAEIDERAATKFERITAQIAAKEQEVAAADASAASYFIQHPEILDGIQYPDDPEMKAKIRSYRESLRSLYSAADSATSPAIAEQPGVPHYVGGELCARCHREQAEFWAGTHHAHAWQTMIDEGAVADLECITCHTVGYMKPGGFDRPDRAEPKYVNVQCENCHGPGSNHVTGISFVDDKSIIGESGDMSCEACHNHEHSPNFTREFYVPRVTCPPIDPREPVIRGVYAMAREELGRRLEKPNAKLSVHVGHLEMSLRLGQYQEALTLAERAEQQFPDVRRISIGSARALDGLGRTGEALEKLNVLYDADPKNPLIVKEMIRLLINGRDQSVRDPAAALALIDWAMAAFGKKDGELHALKASGLHALGRLDEAIATLKNLVNSTLSPTSEVALLLDAMQAERAAEREALVPPPLPLPPMGG